MSEVPPQADQMSNVLAGIIDVGIKYINSVKFLHKFLVYLVTLILMSFKL